MRTWDRAIVPVLCGFCGELVTPGDPVLVVTLPAIDKPRYRCPGCVGEPVPELPAVVERGASTKRMTPIRALKVPLPADWKTRASGA